jgi:hypothetical protein
MSFSGRELRFKDQGKELMLVGSPPCGVTLRFEQALLGHLGGG